MTKSIAAIILAAGRGTRMKSDIPKVLHPVVGKAMIAHVLGTVEDLGVQRRIAVVAPGQHQVAEAVRAVDAQTLIAIQQQPRGTGDAVRAALGALDGFSGTVLVAYGDTPLITTATLERMVEARQGTAPPDVVVLGFPAACPGRYGRLINDGCGQLERIVEAADVGSDDDRATLCNGGVMAIDSERLGALLDELSDDNAGRELYLTDIVALARSHGGRVAVVETTETETLGVDSRADLARAEALMQNRLRQVHMAAGVTLVAPGTVFLSHDTEIGRDTIVHPNVTIGPGVSIGKRVEIQSFCHIEATWIADDSAIGPFARLRAGTTVEQGARIGNFVEVKAAAIGPGTKANHLAYIGDARVGARSNIGAGTITCNFDGFSKHFSDIGDGVFIGSNTALVAPVSIGDGAIIGAGSTVTESVEADALFVMRGQARLAKDGARRFRARRRPVKLPDGEQD